MGRRFLIAAALAALVAGIYARTVDHEFTLWDDDKNIYENESIRTDTLSEVPVFWKLPFQGLYIPVTYTAWSLLAVSAEPRPSEMLSGRIIVNAFPYRVANILVHLVCTALVIFLVFDMLDRKHFFAAVAGGALFALHPLQVEPVAWATGMKDLLGTCLALGAIVFYRGHSRQAAGSRPRAAFAWFALSLIFFVLSLLAKPSLVVIPAVIWLLEVLLRRAPVREGVWPPRGDIAGLCAVSLALAAGWMVVTRKSWLLEYVDDPWSKWALTLTGVVAGLAFLAAIALAVLNPADKRASAFRELWPWLAALPVFLLLFWILGVAGGWHPAKVMLLASLGWLGLIAWRWPGISANPLTRLIPFFAMSLLFVIITRAVQPPSSEIFLFNPPPLWKRPLVALDALGFYTVKLIFPFGLATEYGRNPDVALGDFLRRPLWLVPIVIGAFCLYFLRRDRSFYFTGLGIVLLGVLPVLGLIPFNYQAQSTVADRYLYFSFLGVALIAAIWLSHSTSRLPWIVAGALTLFFTVMTWRQVPVWENSFTMLKHGLSVNPVSPTMQYNLGLAYSEIGERQRAIHYFLKAIEIKEDFARPYNNIGYSLNEQGRYQEAIPYLDKAVAYDPDSEIALSNLGISYDSLGDHERAIALYRKGLELSPDKPDILSNLGLAFKRQGDLASSLDCFTQVAHLRPHWFQPHRGRGEVLFLLGRFDEAAKAFETTVRITADNAYHHRLHAEALAFAGLYPEAVAAADRALAAASAVPGYPADEIALLTDLAESCRRGVPPATTHAGEVGKPAPE